MNAAEARRARETLGLTPLQLAVEMKCTPAVVTAWEEGRIQVPPRNATVLAWRAAVHERQAALKASGLPVCAWMESFERSSSSERSKRLDEVIAHQGCEICAARDAYIAERFPPMPRAPQPGVMAVVIPIAKRIAALPRWAQAPATGAILFIAYSLLKILLSLPILARSGWAGLLTAAEGIAASGAIGGIVGFIYDLYRRRRDGASSREKKAALEMLDGQMSPDKRGAGSR